MRVTNVAEVQDNAAPHRRAPILWPWVLVAAAWTLAGLAVLTNQSYLINHHYLLEESHLPVLVALVVFLACWQVMTVGMMLPSSMPMVYMIVHAGRRQRRPYAVAGVFLAGYAVVWTSFAVVAFLADTQIHWLAHHWALARHEFLGDWRDYLRGRWHVPVQSAEGALPETVPQPLRLLCALLSPGDRGSLASWCAPRRILPGLLLGADAGHVWAWRGQPGDDGAADQRHGHREDLSWWAAAEPRDRDRLAGTSGPMAGSSRLAPRWDRRVSIRSTGSGNRFACPEPQHTKEGNTNVSELSHPCNATGN